MCPTHLLTMPILHWPPDDLRHCSPNQALGMMNKKRHHICRMQIWLQHEECFLLVQRRCSCSICMGCFTPAAPKVGSQDLHSHPYYNRGVSLWQREGRRSSVCIAPMTVSFSHSLCGKMWITVSSGGLAKGSIVLFSVFLWIWKLSPSACFVFFLKVILSLGRSFTEPCLRTIPFQEAGVSRGHWTWTQSPWPLGVSNLSGYTGIRHFLTPRLFCSLLSICCHHAPGSHCPCISFVISLIPLGLWPIWQWITSTQYNVCM